MRLQKYMAECGAGSRRRCEELIKSGRVSVDGAVVTEMGVKINPLDNRVELDGKTLVASAKIYIALNKPEGCVTTADDQFGRATVLDYVKDISARIFPVGRLDYNSSGLLFLTNDGDFAYKLTHPKHNIKKTYLVTVEGEPSESGLNALREGILLEDGPTRPAEVWFTDRSKYASTLTIVVMEGRNRLVRRMMAATGHSVLNLHRTAVGGVEIGGLSSGEYRHLSEGELKLLSDKGV